MGHLAGLGGRSWLDRTVAVIKVLLPVNVTIINLSDFIATIIIMITIIIIIMKMVTRDLFSTTSLSQSDLAKARVSWYCTCNSYRRMMRKRMVVMIMMIMMMMMMMMVTFPSSCETRSVEKERRIAFCRRR